MSKFERYFEITNSFVAANNFLLESSLNNKEIIFNSSEFKDLSKKIINILFFEDEIEIDLNGHNKELDKKKISDIIKDSRYNYFIKDIEFKIIVDLFAIKSKEYGKNFKSFLILNNNSIVNILDTFNCPDCGTYISTKLDFNTNKITPFLDIEKCQFSENTPEFINVDLKVPSKKLVFLNDPRMFIKLEREDKYKNSINYLIGCIKETEMYAEHNIGYFFIGNCYPSILQNKSEIIFTNAYSGEDDEIDDVVEYNNLNYHFRGNVCTGIWWYTLLDYDLFASLCKEKNVLESDIEHTIVDIESEQCSVKHSLEAHKEGDSDEDLSFISF